MSEPHSEADTRQQIIDKRLRLAGWDVGNPDQVEQELAIYIGNRRRSGTKGSEPIRSPYDDHRFADYALLLKGQPQAIIEAKKTSRDAQVGQEQARQYSEQLQAIHGGLPPFVMYSNGHETFFWDTELYPPARVVGFPTPADLEWLAQRRETRGPLSAELIDTGIAGRDYQIEAIRTLLEAIEQRRRKFLMVMATGTGKTRTAVALVDVLTRAHWVKRVLFLVDRIPLQEQALDWFEEYLPSAPRWPERGGEPFNRARRIYVTTYPSMLNLIQAGTEPSTWISPFFFDLVIADESHRGIYNIYKQVLTYFHGLTLGLTATPRDHVTHDTFDMFDCPVNDPTFGYGYDEAVNHEPPYLCRYEVLKLSTRFQVEGIRGPRLEPSQQEQLELEGLDPEAIDFEGTDIEKKVTNSGTNAVIVREFMETCIKDPTGTLPGKSIIFACSVAHARRLHELFDQLYPEHRGRLVSVITADDSRAHGKGGLLDQFKRQDFPRIAISVDMLDTGVDVREVVNLVFAKPVYSYVKFWQMIGRGTRVLPEDPAERKPWCPEKDRFLIIDCWGNFDFFQMEPEGHEPAELTPLPVRLFRARLDLLEAALARPTSATLAETIKADLQADLGALPANNVVVLENAAHLARVRHAQFWQHVQADDLAFLRRTIAPILRAQAGINGNELRFHLDVTAFGTALLAANRDAMDVLRESIVSAVSELPLGIALVARERDLIEATLGNEWWAAVDHERLRNLARRLGPLMKHRVHRTESMLSLSLADIAAQRERIVIGPDGRDLPIAVYRQRVEDAVRRLLAENPVLQRLQAGEPVTEADVHALAELLRAQDPAIDEDRLRRVYDVRTASFVELIGHVLGVQSLERWSTWVARRFDEFIAEHSNYSAQQVRFLQTLRTFVLQRGQVARGDLIEPPFTRLHPSGIRGVFPPTAIEEILAFTAALAA